MLEDPLKLIVHTDPARPAELFDVRADPAEERPLENREAAERLRARLDAWWPAGAAAKGPERRR